MTSGSYVNLDTDAIQVSDFYDSSDDDEDNIRYSLPQLSSNDFFCVLLSPAKYQQCAFH